MESVHINDSKYGRIKSASSISKAMIAIAANAADKSNPPSGGIRRLNGINTGVTSELSKLPIGL